MTFEDHPPVAMVLDNRTAHLPTAPTGTGKAVLPSVRKGLRLSDLRRGETGRVLRVATADPGCRKRFAELGLAEGRKVTVTAAGDVLMLVLSGGGRMGMAARCAEEIFVSRISS